MLYALVFGILGGYLGVLAMRFGGWCWALFWPALAFGLVAVAFAGLGPGVLGKRANGRLAWWAVLLLLPYLALSLLLWHAVRLLSREPCCNEVAPGIWVGRRAYASELPPGITVVVDMTAELTESRAVVANHAYLCLPTLDTAAPEPTAFMALVEKLRDHVGSIYIHCASGHGRSATLAAGLLLARGLARDVPEAEHLLRRARPGIHLKKAQRALLECCLTGLKQEHANAHEDCHP